MMKEIFLALAGLTAAGTAWGQCGPRSLDRVTPRPDVLVSTPWLAAHLRDSGLVVLQVDADAASYRAAHIPGARLADPMAFTVGEHELASDEALRPLIEALGIGNGSRVVLYGETWHVGWLYVVLDRLGHGARTSLLDGGLPQWRLEGRALEAGASPAVARTRFTVSPQDVVATTEWLRGRLGSRRVAIIDVRTREEYLGGHIPTARHLDWIRTFTRPDSALNNQASLFVDLDQLDTMFRAAGAGPGKDVVIYCTVGLRASLVYVIAKRLGYEPRFYDGSWSAWSGAGQPTVTGTEPGSVR